MALKQEQFVPFMIVVAIAFALWIVYTSFSYQSETSSKFEQEIATNDSLVVWNFPLIENEPSSTISIDSLVQAKQKGALLIFVSSWSPKSFDVLTVLDQQYKDELVIIVAVVKDTKDAAKSLKNQFSEQLFFVDGMSVYNEMRAPGLPTTIVYDKNLTLKGVFVGNKTLNELDKLVQNAN
jgi:hypothetical protein